MNLHKASRALMLLVLIAFVVLLLVDSRQNSPEVRLLPRIVGGLTLCLLLVLFVAEFNPRLRRFTRQVSSFEFMDTAAFAQQFAPPGEPGVAEAGDQPAEPAPYPPAAAADSASAQRRRQWQFMAWVLAFFVALLFVGFLWSIPVFLLAFWLLQARERPLRAVLLTGGFVTFIYVLFGMVLRLPIRGGLLY